MKYIDADRFRAEIEKRIAKEEQYLTADNINNPEREIWIQRDKDLLSIVTSLLREQPESNEIEKSWSLQIQAYLTTASDELYAPGKRLYTKEHHEGIHECMKMWQKLHHYYFSTKQEQDVDLEKEITDYFQGCWPGTETPEQCNTDMHFTPLAIIRLIKHFYELGLKARKEDKQ